MPLNGPKGSLTMYRPSRSTAKEPYPDESGIQHPNSVIENIVAHSIKD